MVYCGGLHPAYNSADCRLGYRRSLSALLSSRDALVSRLGTRCGLRVNTLSLSHARACDLHNAADFFPDVCRHAYQIRSTSSSGFLNNVAVSDPHDTADICLRRVLYRLYGKCYVLVARARVETKNFWRHFPSTAFT